MQYLLSNLSFHAGQQEARRKNIVGLLKNRSIHVHIKIYGYDTIQCNVH